MFLDLSAHVNSDVASLIENKALMLVKISDFAVWSKRWDLTVISSDQDLSSSDSKCCIGRISLLKALFLILRKERGTLLPLWKSYSWLPPVFTVLNRAFKQVSQAHSAALFSRRRRSKQCRQRAPNSLRAFELSCVLFCLLTSSVSHAACHNWVDNNFV